MTDRSFTTTLVVDLSAKQVYDAINDVRGWWHGEIDGPTDHLGDVFTYRHGDLHCSTQQVIELTPGTRIAWRVTEANLSFAADPAEWVGTEITFDLSRVDDSTEVRFTHRGLRPELGCFEACSGGWQHYVDGGLASWLATRSAA
ncbi:MAG: SRPBCC domain-containing protein [Pseudonocardiales bacterium]|nr:SRPBCC domain-containing protein [Pseudonocardiales bacterium]